MKMNNYKRLHVVSILSEFFKVIKRIMFPAIIAYFIGNSTEQVWISSGYKELIVVISLTVAILYGLYRWVTFKYKVDKDKIHIKNGFL